MHELLKELHRNIKTHESEMDRISSELRTVQDKLIGLPIIVEMPITFETDGRGETDFILCYRDENLIVYRRDDNVYKPQPVNGLSFNRRMQVHAIVPTYLAKVNEEVKARLDKLQRLVPIVSKEAERQEEEFKWNQKDGPKTKGMY